MTYFLDSFENYFVKTPTDITSYRIDIKISSNFFIFSHTTSFKIITTTKAMLVILSLYTKKYFLFLSHYKIKLM